jgi:AcrR family transcriptional regulator
MPKLWTSTIEAHRAAVRDAVLDAVAKTIGEHGIGSVTMTGVAEASGIGRATLYKYFPDVEAILLAWHERQVALHLQQLAAARDGAAGPLAQLVPVLETFAQLATGEHEEVMGFLHRAEHVARADHHVLRFVADIIEAGAAAGELRSDIPTVELARFSIQAVRGTGSARAARQRVRLTVDALRRSAQEARS